MSKIMCSTTSITIHACGLRGVCLQVIFLILKYALHNYKLCQLYLLFRTMPVNHTYVLDLLCQPYLSYPSLHQLPPPFLLFLIHWER
jgi:hypothetical protein